MEGAGVVRESEVGRRPGPARLVAGIGVLVILALIGALLLPPYYHNWQFQRYIRSIAHDPGLANQPPGLVLARIVDRAASMGLPVHITDVHVTESRGNRRIEVLYVVHVELPVYTVDLHFRPTA